MQLVEKIYTKTPYVMRTLLLTLLLICNSAFCDVFQLIRVNGTNVEVTNQAGFEAILAQVVQGQGPRSSMVD